MSSKKLKPELMAICKLEFYRKQKSWRLCPQDRKGKDSKKRPKAINVKLNQTYNIAPPPAPAEKEPSKPNTPEPDDCDILDEAFVDTETGTESDDNAPGQSDILNNLETAEKPSSQLDPPGSPYSPKWSIQRWAERHHLWNPEPSCPTQETFCPTKDLICPTQDPNCPAQDTVYHTYHPTYPTNFFQEKNPSEDANCPIFDNNFNIQQDLYYSNQYSYPKGTEYVEPNYPTQSDTKYDKPLPPINGISMVYYNSNMCHHRLDVPESGANILDVEKLRAWEIDDWEQCAGEGAIRSDQDWLGEAAAVGAGGEDALDGDWRLLDMSGLSRSDSLPSVASSEFIRGAALAPHSTQIDLLVVPEPACLPPAALAAAVARHSAALQALLLETQRRQEAGPDPSPKMWVDTMCKEVQPSPTDRYSFDEVPVRDPGPVHAPLFDDRIVAGSRPTPDLRGRTRTAGQVGTTAQDGTAGQVGTAGQDEGGRCRGRPKVEIRMGRPYRL